MKDEFEVGWPLVWGVEDLRLNLSKYLEVIWGQRQEGEMGREGWEVVAGGGRRMRSDRDGVGRARWEQKAVWVSLWQRGAFSLV